MQQFAPTFPVSDASLSHYARHGFTTSVLTGDSAPGGHGFARHDTVDLDLHCPHRTNEVADDRLSVRG